MSLQLEEGANHKNNFVLLLTFFLIFSDEFVDFFYPIILILNEHLSQVLVTAVKDVNELSK